MALTGIVLIPVSVDTWMKELCPGDAKHRAPIYENTRRFVRSAKNPYFWCDEAGTGFMHERFPQRRELRPRAVRPGRIRFSAN